MLITSLFFVNCGLMTDEGRGFEKQKPDDKVYNNTHYKIEYLHSQVLKYENISFLSDKVFNYTFLDSSIFCDIYKIGEQLFIESNSNLTPPDGKQFDIHETSSRGDYYKITGISFLENNIATTQYNTYSDSTGVIVYNLNNKKILKDYKFDTSWYFIRSTYNQLVTFKVIDDSFYIITAENYTNGEVDTLYYIPDFKTLKNNPQTYDIKKGFNIIENYDTYFIASNLYYLESSLYVNNHDYIYLLDENIQYILTSFKFLGEFKTFSISNTDSYILSKSSPLNSHYTSDHRIIYEDNKIAIALINDKGDIINEHCYEFKTTDFIYYGGYEAKAVIYFDDKYFMVGINSAKNIWLKIFDKEFNLSEDAVFNKKGGDFMNLSIVEDKLFITNFIHNSKKITVYKLQK